MMTMNFLTKVFSGKEFHKFDISVIYPLLVIVSRVHSVPVTQQQFWLNTTFHFPMQRRASSTL